MSSKLIVLPLEKLGEVRRQLTAASMPGGRRGMRGALAGAAAGLLGAWAMSQFADVSSRWFDLNRKTRRRGHKPLGSEEEMDATFGVARLLTRSFAGAELSRRQEYRAAVAVHYSIGVALGASYGALAEVAPVVTTGFGTAFTATEWGIGEFLGPLLPFMKRSYPTSVRLHALAGHVVLGLTMELARRGIRATISRLPASESMDSAVFRWRR
ncbi:MAG: hypothetical protein ACE14M_04470 [Terriglobales bacterium]